MRQHNRQLKTLLKKYLLFYLRFLLILVFLPFPQKYAYAGPQSKPDQIKLKAVVLPYLSFAPLFIAEEEGFFEEQGLQVDFIKMTEVVQAIPALIKGELDVIGDALYPSYLNAMARGVKMKIVADRGYLPLQGCSSTALMARRALIEEGKLNSVSQIRGLRVAMTQAATISTYYVERLLTQANLTLADVQTVLIPIPLRPAAFEKGAIDISLANEPWITQIQNGGHAVLWMSVQQIAPDFQHGFLLYGPTLMEKNPEAGKRFMVAYLKAVRQYNRGKIEPNMKILMKHTGLNEGLLKKCCWPSMRSDGRIHAESLLDFQRWAIRSGHMDKEVPKDQFWDPSFIEYANQQLNIPKK
jgi:NitT/TauT family transport system substrate-binding protein